MSHHPEMERVAESWSDQCQSNVLVTTISHMLAVYPRIAVSNRILGKQCLQQLVKSYLHHVLLVVLNHYPPGVLSCGKTKLKKYNT